MTMQYCIKVSRELAGLLKKLEDVSPLIRVSWVYWLFTKAKWFHLLYKNIFNLIPVFLLFFYQRVLKPLRKIRVHEEILTELVNKRCWIIPDATVESCWMVPQLIENLLHLKSCQNIFNQHCCFDRSQWQAQLAIQNRGVSVNIDRCKTNRL